MPKTSHGPAFMAHSGTSPGSLTMAFGASAPFSDSPCFRRARSTAPASAPAKPGSAPAEPGLSFSGRTAQAMGAFMSMISAGRKLSRMPGRVAISGPAYASRRPTVMLGFETVPRAIVSAGIMATTSASNCCSATETTGRATGAAGAEAVGAALPVAVPAGAAAVGVAALGAIPVGAVVEGAALVGDGAALPLSAGGSLLLHPAARTAAARTGTRHSNQMDLRDMGEPLSKDMTVPTAYLGACRQIHQNPMLSTAGTEGRRDRETG